MKIKFRNQKSISYIFDHAKYDYEKKIQKKYRVHVLNEKNLTLIRIIFTPYVSSTLQPKGIDIFRIGFYVRHIFKSS